MEKNIDCMKYRKSTHLAGVDVDTIIAEKGNCILTIKEAYYNTGVNVSGNKSDGYFLEFMENQKPMMVNSINRKTISDIVKIKNKCTSAESRNIGNWKGLKIELLFDPNVKMMGKITGGIRVNPVSPIIDVDDKEPLSLLNSSKTLEDLKANWSKLTKDQQDYPTISKLKDELKNKLK